MIKREKQEINPKNKSLTYARKIKKRYTTLNMSLWAIPSVQSKVKNITKLVQVTKDNRQKADEIQSQSKEILKNSAPAQQLLDELSVSTLKDIYDIETKGSVQKYDFFDVIGCNDKRRNVMKIVENNDIVLSKIREIQIEVLQIQINKLLEVIEDGEI